MIALCILLSLLFLFIVFCVIMIFTKLTLVVSIDKKGIKIKLKKFKIGFTFKIEKKEEDPRVKENAKKVESEKKVMNKFLNIRNTFMRQKSAVAQSLSYLKGKITLCEVALYGYFGTGNPMTGGIVCGTVYAFFNTVLGFLGNFFDIPQKPHVNVKLKENQCICDLSGAFMIKAKPYDVIKAVIIYKKTLKKGF